jgi:hypothetical protein
VSATSLTKADTQSGDGRSVIEVGRSEASDVVERDTRQRIEGEEVAVDLKRQEAHQQAKRGEIAFAASKGRTSGAVAWPT